MEGNLIIDNVKIVTPLGKTAVRGAKMNNLQVLEGASIVIENGFIRYTGSTSKKVLNYSEDVYNMIDAKGNVALPGFIDSHTHLIFGGLRADEFEWRLKGNTYMSIMERGGGIQSTVNATNLSSKDDLIKRASWFLRRMIEMGVTTVEAKSGYGLDEEAENKMLDVIEQLSIKEEGKIDIIPTFMGAHAIPPKFKGKTSDYIDSLIEMLPIVKKKAVFCDIFCEKNVFEIEDSRRFLNAAKERGFKLKLHADEIVSLGGAELASELKAVSADHLLHVSEKGIKEMSAAGVVATLLPLTAFALKEPYAPARKLIDGDCAVALATDLNPGSCFSGSIPLTIALACIYMDMSVEETITALTLNGAAALDMANTKGSIEVGKQGDIIMLGTDNYKVLPYYIGMNCVKTTIKSGKIVYQN